MTNEIVSIIIPAYNAEKRILACLKSCERQSYSNIEIIVVDDGSEDNTLQLIREEQEKDPRIHFYHTDNMGVCSARNIGIEHSTGKYIMFLDSDDELKEYAVCYMLNLTLDNCADISICSHELRYDTKKIVHHFDGDSFIWENRASIVESLKDNTATYSVWGKLYSREIIGESRFEVGRKIHEDSFFFFLLCLKEPKIIISNEIVYEKYCEDSVAASTSFSEKYLDMLYFAKKKSQIVEENYPEYMDLANNIVLKANLALLSLCLSYGFKGIRTIEKNCILEVKQRRHFFISATPYNSKLFFIVKNNLYFPLKLFYRIKIRYTIFRKFEIAGNG